MVNEKLTINELSCKANQIRKDVLTMIYNSQTGHTGGALSSTDIMTALYYGILHVSSKAPEMENRDRFILSKGHCVEPLWCILADKGFINKEELNTFSGFGSRLIGHPNNKVAGVEMNTGSLGHGLSVASGMALSAKRSGETYKVFTLMGDGEQAEGSVWEAAMFAAHYRLDNLIAIIDRNSLQISGPTEDVMSLEPFSDKWTAFGWNVISVDGNNMNELIKVLSQKTWVEGMPTVIIANTIKGKGVSFIENQASWHHGAPNTEQFEMAIAELDLNESVEV